MSGGMIFSVFKFLFGEVPAQWLRLVIFGAGVALVLIKGADYVVKIQAESLAVRGELRDVRKEMKEQGDAIRAVMGEYVASNKAWQDASVKERRRLVGQFNRRVEKVSRRLGIEYDWIEAEQ